MANDILRIQNFLLRFIKDIHIGNIQKSYDNIHKIYGNSALSPEDQVLATQSFLNSISNNSPSLDVGSFLKIMDLGIVEQNLEIYLAKEVYRLGADGLQDPASKEIFVLDFDDPDNRAITERGFLKLDEINIKKIGRNAEERLRNLEGFLKIKFTNIQDFEENYKAVHISQFKKILPAGTQPRTQPFSIKELMYSNISSFKPGKSYAQQQENASGAENTKFLILIRFKEINGASGDPHPFINYLNKKQLLLSVNSYKHTFNFADNEKMNMALSNELTIVFTSYVETVARDTRTIHSNIFDAVDPVLSSQIEKIKNEIQAIRDGFLTFCKENPSGIEAESKRLVPKLQGKITSLQQKVKDAENVFYDAFDKNIRLYRYKVSEKEFNLVSDPNIGALLQIGGGLLLALLLITPIGAAAAAWTGFSSGVIFLIGSLGLGTAAGGAISLYQQGAVITSASSNPATPSALLSNSFTKAVGTTSNGKVQIFAVNNTAVSPDTPLDGTSLKLSNNVQQPNNSINAVNDKINVDFFYLGDLMNMFYNYQPKFYNEEALLMQVPFYQPSVTPQNGLSANPVPVNIGDIPISYELFVQFVNQEIFQKKVDYYPVELFIDKLLNFVESTFTILYFGNSTTAVNWTKCSFARDVLSLPNDNSPTYNNNIFNETFTRKGRANITPRPPTNKEVDSRYNINLSNTILNNIKKTNNYSFYKVYRSNIYNYRKTNFYDEFKKSATGTNVLFNDEATIDSFINFLNKKYYIAGFPIVYARSANTSRSYARLTRKFQFSRIDLPGLKEAQLVNDGFKGYFREPYNVAADFSPLAFLFFETGTPFFCITPPNILSKDVATGNFGNILGLGGLYVSSEIEGNFRFMETSCTRLDTSKSNCNVKGVFSAYGDGTITPYDSANPETVNCVTKLVELETEALKAAEKPAESGTN